MVMATRIYHLIAVFILAVGTAHGFNLEDSRPMPVDPLIASTYLGGSANEGEFREMSVALDAAGNVFIAGHTSSTDFPVTAGAYDATLNGDYDVFIAKFDAGLSNLLAATFLGGGGFDGGQRGAPYLCIDASGDLWVAGQTKSPDFPVTAGAYDETYNGGYDLFVARLDNDLSAVLCSTYLGGAKLDNCSALVQGPGGEVFLSGYTKSDDFPTTPGAFATTYSGPATSSWGGDIIVSRLSSDLTQLTASTFVGGVNCEMDAAMVADSLGNLYVTGTTASGDFPATPGAYDTSLNPGLGGYRVDGFIFKINAGLDTLLCSTFLGGSLDDWSYALTLDNQGDVIVTGHTSSNDFPVTPGAYDTTFNGLWGVDQGDDLFVSRLDPFLGTLHASTYLGGTYWDMGNSLAVDAGNHILVAGQASSSDFPTTSGAYGETYSGGSYDWGGEVVLARFDSLMETLEASTFLGGGVQDGIGSIVLGASGHLYVTGYTNSPDFPVTPDAYDETYNGSGYGKEVGDAYLACIDAQLSGISTLTADTQEVPASTGGQIGFSLDAGPGNANRSYLVVGSLSGTTPGLTLPGGLVTLPVNWDGFSDLEMALLNTPAFTGFLGTLNAQGLADARLNVPALPSGAVGVIFHFAYCCNVPFDFASNSVNFEIVP
jgi:hypothetical protein